MRSLPSHQANEVVILSFKIQTQSGFGFTDANASLYSIWSVAVLDAQPQSHPSDSAYPISLLTILCIEN